ncbi:hypothetical protein EMG21_28515 [Klebsiella pneumoniae]|nr:hypothetical protein EMG21_28515 [Klebsiella pneumoniae]
MAAEKITITRAGADFSLSVDGVEIPSNAILRDSVTVPTDPDEPPTVTLTLIARHVDVTNTLNTESETT